MIDKGLGHVNLFILLILTVSCSNDEPGRDHITSQKSWEEKYLEDYEAPEKKWGFIDITGAWKIDAEYDAALDFSEALAAVNKNGYWGFIDTNGFEVISPEYLAAWSFSNATARVLTKHRTYLFINKKGEAIHPEPWEDGTDMTSSGAYVKKSKYWGIMNPEGRMATPLQYDEPGEFMNGFSTAKYRNQWVLIDTVGRILKGDMHTKPEYSGEGFWLINSGDSSFFYKPENRSNVPLGPVQVEVHMYPRVLLKSQEEAFGVLRVDSLTWSHWNRKQWTSCVTTYPGIWTCRDADRTYRLVSDQGMAISAEYTSIHPFEEGLAVFERNGTFGFLDTKGQEVIPNQFLLAWSFRNGLARTIGTDGNLYFIDSKGVIQLRSPGYEARDFSYGLSRCQE